MGELRLDSWPTPDHWEDTPDTVRERVLRRLLKKMRANRKIDHNLYHKFYRGSKGNLYKNKKVLIEAIHRQMNEKVRLEKIEAEQAARRFKNLERRRKKLEKKLAHFKDEKI